MPTPGDVQHMSSCAAAADPEDRSEHGRIYRVRSASDIDWRSFLSVKSSLNPTSREVHESPHRSKICACSASKSPRWTIMASIRSYPKDKHHLFMSCRRRCNPLDTTSHMRDWSVRSKAVFDGCSMEYLIFGSVYSTRSSHSMGWSYGVEIGFMRRSSRRISMIYRQLVSRTSIKCGHFQLLLSIRIGIQ